MNSLNMVSRLAATPPASPTRVNPGSLASGEERGRESSVGDMTAGDEKDARKSAEQEALFSTHGVVDEKTPLLDSTDPGRLKGAPGSRLWSAPGRIAHAVVGGVRVVFATLAAPVRFVIACFYDDRGHFSTIMPLRNFRNLFGRRRRKSGRATPGSDAGSGLDTLAHRRATTRRSPSADSNASSSTMSSDGEGETDAHDSPSRHTRSRTSATQSVRGTAPEKRSIKIKVQHDESLRMRRAAKGHMKKESGAATPDDVAAVASALKSPCSTPHSSKLTRYPRAPAPPRPLVPRRQPSYTLQYSPDTPKKTLIIDLDETLIHSMAKGGRMSTGHMVEVRLGGGGALASSAAFPRPPLGAGVPILYYVHERPGCHDFLRKVSKWYNLVVFTASVQEYADPVIDWLERERRYFGGRYYRQHCTLRNGAYIKDVAQVEPDLSRVMILDNSPMSYIFHEDNAIPIEGWISDPTDNHLVHLVPLLEGLQYVTDVRALLALRQGQAQQA